jgi:hypothetical protein
MTPPGVPSDGSGLRTRDTTLFEFTDADTPTNGPPSPPEDDAILRSLLSRHFLTEQTLTRRPGEMARVRELTRQREEICRRRCDMLGVSRCLGNQAMLLRANGEWLEALRLFEEEAVICRQLNDPPGLLHALRYLALVNEALQNHAQALERAREAQRVALEQGDAEAASQMDALIQRLRAG